MAIASMASWLLTGTIDMSEKKKDRRYLRFALNFYFWKIVEALLR
jgi:hypothetical protein